MQIVSIGELLWDVIGEKEYLGGAPLNFSAAACQLGNSVALLTAVGADTRGERALRAMKELGLTTRFVQTIHGFPTGTATVVTDASGNATYVIERPASFDCLRIEDTLIAHLSAMKPDWIYFGSLAQTTRNSEELLSELVRSLPGIRCFYDLNLRAGHWNLSLVLRLSQIATVLKLNEEEAELLFHLTNSSKGFEIEEFCHYWSAAYDITTICVTLGSKGCAVFTDGRFYTFAGVSVKVVDTIGAGDAFAAAFLHGLHFEWPIEQIASFSNALGALVVSRRSATPTWTIDECQRLFLSYIENQMHSDSNNS